MVIYSLLRIAWGIYGKANNIRESNQTSPDNFSGAFSKTFATGWPNVVTGQIDGAWAGGIEFSSSRVIPVQEEMVPIGVVTTCLLRIAWGIRGRHWGSTYYLAQMEENSYFSPNSFTVSLENGSQVDVYPKAGTGFRQGVYITFDASRVVPTATNPGPLSVATSMCLRILWGIFGTGFITGGANSDYGGALLNNTSMVGSMGQGSNAVRWSTRQNMHVFDSGRVAPVSDEIVTISASVMVLIRILWGIRGFVGAAGAHIFQDQAGCFRDNNIHGAAGASSPVAGQGSGGFYYDNSFVVPICKEDRGLSQQVLALIRISWGIIGQASLVGAESWGFTSGALKLAVNNNSFGGQHPNGTNAILNLDSSSVVPSCSETVPCVFSVACILRVRWGIRGKIGNNEPWSNRGFTGYGWNTATGAFPELILGDMAIKLEPGNEYLSLTAIRFDSSAVVPISLESKPSAISVCSLIRIAWGISGEIGVSGSLSGSGSGAFSFRTNYVAAGGIQGSMNGFWVENGVGSRYYTLASGRMIPTSGEIEPISMVIYSLLRIAWGIRGQAELQGTEWALTSGAFRDAGLIPNQEWSAHEDTRTNRFRLGYDSSRVGPIAQETIPSSSVTRCLLRIFWADRLRW